MSRTAEPATHPLVYGHAPVWASEWGEDQYGVFAGFLVGEVEQKVRWIPPGRFWMGSPDGESGRFVNETRHLVTLTEGFWLADTPCTQELWQQVMDDNPSRFQSPTRPVEQVSWKDCQRFFEVLELRVPGLAPKLPTEAQWEYACRAGTETATWLGDLDIDAEGHARLLNEIAWYNGNSGVDFDLRDWKSGSHPVAGKQPNPRGLYDMLGNVWEWCADRHGKLDAEAETDPEGPHEGGSRVNRGGSWDGTARFVRAAYRYWLLPQVAYSILGFRLALGPGRGAP